MNKPRYSAIITFLICLYIFPIVLLADETLTITTYYPSPYGVYKELRAKRIAIGDTYIDSGAYCWEGTCTNTINANADLVVEGNVGLGTTSPGTILDIKSVSPQLNLNGTGGTLYTNFQSNGTTKWQTGMDNGFGAAGYFIYDNVNTKYAFGINGATGNLFLQPTSGKVGIGITNPTYQLQLSTDSAAKPGTGAWTIASDRRVKKDIRPYTNGLSIIKRINPVWFKYNGKAGSPNDNQDYIGVIGQEIAKVAPYTVNTFKAKLNPGDKEEIELLNFNSHALTFDLINSVKELDSNITKLSQESRDLKQGNKELKSEMENLKTRLSRLEAKAK